MIVPLSPETVEDVAKIHASELPHSPIPRLGHEFMTRFFYGKLLHDPLFYCYVFCHQGKTAGFISFSVDSKKLFRNGIRHHFLLLCRIILKTIVCQPQTLPVVFASILFMKSQKKEVLADIDAEVLTFAILPEFRTVEFYKNTGVKVGEALFSKMAQKYNELKVKQIKLFTETKKANLLAKLFYTSFHMKIEGTYNVRGLEMQIFTGSIPRIMEAVKNKQDR